MTYEIKVCDWTQIERKQRNAKKYGVSINKSVAFENDDLDICHKVAELITDAYNKGVRDMHYESHTVRNSLELKSRTFSDDVFVVTPEMQKANA